jgi:hypothetical protein
MITTFRRIRGIVLSLGSLWLGSYLIGFLTPGGWVWWYLPYILTVIPLSVYGVYHGLNLAGLIRD